MATLALAHPRLIAEDAALLPQARRLATARVIARPDTQPATEGGVHPGAIGLALGGYGVFLCASWAGWAFGYTALLIAVIYFLSAMYFGLLVGGGMIAAASRGDRTRRSFRESLNGRVQTLTGTVSGWNAVVQVAFMPILLGLTMCFFAAVWLCVR
jgi:hypothetical protein